MAINTIFNCGIIFFNKYYFRNFRKQKLIASAATNVMDDMEKEKNEDAEGSDDEAAKYEEVDSDLDGNDQAVLK